MAVVGLKSNEWVNADGLVVWFGSSESLVSRGGEYSFDGALHKVEVLIDLATLPTVASGNSQIVADNVTIPEGAQIEEIQVIVTEVTAGTNSDLNLGLVDQDRTTLIDADGLLAAADAWHAAAIGTKVVYNVGTTEVGALVGTILTNTGLIVASPVVADFTDGVIKVRIFYSIPLAADL